MHDLHVACSCLERTIWLSTLAQHNRGALRQLPASRSSFRRYYLLKELTSHCIVEGDMVRRTTGVIPHRERRLRPTPPSSKCALSVLRQNAFAFFSFPCPSSLHILTTLAYLCVVSLSHINPRLRFSLLPSLPFLSTVLRTCCCLKSDRCLLAILSSFSPRSSLFIQDPSCVVNHFRTILQPSIYDRMSYVVRCAALLSRRQHEIKSSCVRMSSRIPVYGAA